MLSVANTETPTVTLQISFHMGQRDEPEGKAGLARLTAAMMNEASRQRSAAEFTEALERIGANVGVHSGKYHTSVSLSTLSKHLDSAMDLLMERLLQPAFTQEDFDRIKTRTMESLLQSQKSGSVLAGRASSAVLLGAKHPLSFPASGLPSTVENVTLEDVRNFYAAHIPTRMRGVLVSSNVPPSRIDQLLAALGELPVEEPFRESIEAMPEITGRTIYLVNKADATQSSLRIVHPSLPYDALGDYYRAGLMNFNLGGSFDSRINLSLREDKGWTYGASTGFSGGPELGRFQFGAEVNRESTQDAISETLSIIETFVEEGMTEEEYQYMQNAVTQSEALRYETPGRKFGLISQILSYDLPLNYRSQQKSLLAETDRETLNELAGKLIHPENVAIIVVGDVATLTPVLEKFHLPIRRLDEEGFELKE